jgi:arsenate reductase (thioredoxin)
MSKIRVLFLCTGNSARSQMAEAFLRTYAGDRFEAYSAGLEPGGIHPLTKKVMDEMGIDISGQRSKSLTEYIGKVHFGFLITVCSAADKNCPVTFVGFGQKLHWDIADPVAFAGTEEEKLRKFRDVRDEIKQRIEAWVDSLS